MAGSHNLRVGIIGCGDRGTGAVTQALLSAESTMAAIMRRMSAYTGRALKWDWAMKSSQLNLTPPKYDFIDLQQAPIAVPGITKLI